MKLYGPAELFSSRARFLLLRCLYAFGQPLPLRQAEALTGLAVRSVQVAVRGLEKEGIVKTKKAGRFLFLKLNSRHADYVLTGKLFALINREFISHRAVRYAGRGQSSLELSEAMQGLVKKAVKC